LPFLRLRRPMRPVPNVQFCAPGWIPPLLNPAIQIEPS
jgi:hypothetical protein